MRLLPRADKGGEERMGKWGRTDADEPSAIPGERQREKEHEEKREFRLTAGCGCHRGRIKKQG